MVSEIAAVVEGLEEDEAHHEVEDEEDGEGEEVEEARGEAQKPSSYVV